MGRLTDLTPKELLFCRHVANGDTYSDAYRKAYDTQAGMRSVNSKASALMAKPDIRGRVEQLVKAKEQAIIRSSLSDRQQVIDRLKVFADSATSADMARIRATELWGKAVGVFDAPGQDDSVDERTAAELESDLQTMLSTLLGGDIEGEYSLVPYDTDEDDTATDQDSVTGDMLDDDAQDDATDQYGIALLRSANG